MRRVMIFGAAGTGKSTLGTALGRILGVPVIHLDLIVWYPGCRVVDDGEFEALHRDLIAREAWVLDGIGH